jgi:choline dehydrogenase-like flavoprotein
MIIDARSIPEDTTIDTDVCIIGCGISGLTIAHELRNTSYQLCLLESGGMEPDIATQSLYEGDNIGLPYAPLDETRARYCGGSSHYWHIELGNDRIGARMRPLDPIDFEEREWVPYSGWPFSKADLDPFYARAEAFCHLEPCTWGVADWEDAEKRPSLPFQGDRVQTIIYKFMERDLFALHYRKEVTQQADNIRALLHANAVEIETDTIARSVTRVRIACLQGQSFWVKAKVVVLAMGGIEIPRLLLLSNQTQRAGIGNQHDRVGRFFMEHPHFTFGFCQPAGDVLSRCAPLYDCIQPVKGVPILGKLALTEQTLRHEKLLNQNVRPTLRMVPQAVVRYPLQWSQSLASYQRLCAALHMSQGRENLGTHFSQTLMGLDDLACAAYGKIRRSLEMRRKPEDVPVYFLSQMAEQVPNPNSRVTLGAERDALGQPRAQLNWQLSDTDFQSVIRTMQIMDEEWRRAGIGSLFFPLKDPIPPPNLHGGMHHMGTTRMHIDPHQGVVDTNCQVHDMSNLFIAGSSVFPTGGYANPTLTIVALSIRLADHLKATSSAFCSS